MKPERFWAIVEPAHQAASKFVEPSSKYDELIRVLTAQLRALPPRDLVEFNETKVALARHIRTHELWAVAFIAFGGCSSDGFMDFRYWLVCQGRAAYDQALADPEGLVPLLREWGETPKREDCGALPVTIYGERFGTDMPDSGLGGPPEMKGVPWKEEDLPTRFPRAWRAFAEHGSSPSR